MEYFNSGTASYVFVVLGHGSSNFGILRFDVSSPSSGVILPYLFYNFVPTLSSATFIGTQVAIFSET